MRTRGMAGTVLDTAVIASSFEFEEPKLQALLDAPTVELVKEFLTSLTLKAQEFDDVKAEKLRADVELENTVRSNETRVKSLKTSVNKGLKDVEELRRSLSAQETARAELQSEIDAIRSCSTESTSEVETLHTRISTLEASNRETLAVLEAKSSSHDRIAEELATQHQKIVALRREVSTLEEKNQSLENAASTNKFKEQNLLQEVDLLKRNNEWHEQELKTRSAEHTKFRKEKNARVSELQRANEDATTSIDALKRTETALRQRLGEVSQKADDAFAKIQQLQEAAAKSEESFTVELDSARRLADLQKQSSDTSRARLQELQDTIEQVKDSAADEIGQLQAEIETERSDKENVERKLAELELEIERLQASASHQAPQSTPGTPLRATNGFTLGTPRRLASPAPFTPGSARMKGNLSFTQLVSENNALKSELEAANRRIASLGAEMDEMIQALENHAPEQEELRQDKERMEAEVMEMSALLDTATAERDESQRDRRKWEGQVQGLAREGDILRQQLRDVSAQLKIVLVEMQARDQGLDSLDAAGQMQLQMLANGELDEDSASDQTSAGSLISQRLLLFKNVSELQEQNAQLLKLNRGLAERMEGDDARIKEAEQADNMRELEELRERVQRHQDELRSMTTQADSIMRERDMFRRMLSHRGQLPANADLQSAFGQSVDGRATPSTPPPGGHSRLDESPRSKELADYGKLLKDMQSHFDSYRQEAATDHNTLKQQVDRLSRERGELQSEVTRTHGQYTLAQERHEMLQANYRMLQGENTELQKRSQLLAENAAKQDLRTQQVAEDLFEAKTLADSMRTETANLKAERELWKKIEARINEDNRLLMDERSRLNKMVADLQNLQNERDLADSDARRRLQSRAEAIESELETVRKKLEAEVEDSKKAALRREYDQEQSRTRIDDLVKSLSNVREELVATKTTRDQLHTRVDELKIELRTAEERAQALQPRPTPRAQQTTENGDETADRTDNLSREQQLALEVADLKRDLDLVRGELESTKSQVDQYKAISQSTEEELNSLNETADQYREEMDRSLLEKDNKIKELEQRVEDLGSELTTTNSELSDLRTQHEESGIRLEEQKAALETEVARLRDECERYTETAKLHQEDLKAQAEIAQQAQQSYEDELVKHADAAKGLQNVRAEYNALRTEVAAIRAEAEAAKASLAQSEENWSEVRERYENEISDIKNGREDLKTQNKRLHEQLESVSKQIAELQQKRATTTDDNDEGAHNGSGLDNMQEVIKYLRREKEIVDVQYELSMQESKRLRQQLEYAQSQLDETRQKLSDERREQVDKEASAISHQKLLQTINELNLFRESSTTLRQEARQAQSQLQEKIKEVESLALQIEPLQVRLREVENELETKEGEMKLLQDDRDSWRDRTQNIISKYDRVDPAELESLKTQITDLRAERDQLVNDKQQMQEQVDGLPGQIQQVKDEADKSWQEQKARFVEQAKSRSREQSQKIRELEKDVSAAREDKDRISQELAQAQQNLDDAKNEKDEAVARADIAAQEKAQADADREEGQIHEDHDTAISAAAEVRIQQAETRAQEEAVKATSLASEVETLQARVTELEGQVNDLQHQLASANASIIASNSIISNGADKPATEPSADNLEHYEKLKEDLAAAQQEVETLRTAAAAAPVESQGQVPMPSSDGNSIQDVTTQVAEQVSQLRKELEEQHASSQKQLEESYAERTKKMKELLNQKLKEGREKFQEEIRQETLVQHSTEIQNLKQEHEAAIARLNEEHRQVVERVTREGHEAVQKAQASSAATQEVQMAEPTSATEAGTPLATPVKAEGQFLEQLSITDDQARQLVQKNSVIRTILSNNIKTKVTQEATRLKEEHDKAMQEKTEDATKEREQAVVKAVNMETMKQKAKLGMAENKERTVKYKLELVETAAKETPQKPVVEVWEVVRTAKPPPASTVVAPKPDTSAVQLPTTAAIPPSQSAAPANLAEMTTVSASKQIPQPVIQSQIPQDRMQARQDRFGTPSAPSANGGVSQAGSFGQPSYNANQVTGVAQSDQTSNSPATPATDQQASSHPPRAESAAGTGPAALRAITTGGIPRAGGSMLPKVGGGPGRGRGGGGLAASVHAPANQQGFSFQGAANHRGGGQSGIGRGGPAARGGRGGGQQAGRGGSHAQGGGSPMNATARQFNPGQNQGSKRPHDGGDTQGDGKRIRGGAGGGA